jgi:flagellar motility protein MotE (MotC chaperone)
MSGNSSICALAAFGGLLLLCEPALAQAQAQPAGLTMRPAPQPPRGAGPSLSAQMGLPSPGAAAPPPPARKGQAAAARTQQGWSPIIVTTGGPTEVRASDLAPAMSGEQHRRSAAGGVTAISTGTAHTMSEDESQTPPQAQRPIADPPARASPEATMLAPTAPAAVARPEASPSSSSIAQQYCEAIVDQAADARFAWQKKLIADMERELEKRMALLEEKVVEYQKWVARRDEFAAKANEGLVRIYARMRADAAAGQLSVLDEETAAAVINKLDPKAASQILNEMESGSAARLVGIIAGAAKVATRTESKP